MPLLMPLVFLTDLQAYQKVVGEKFGSFWLCNIESDTDCQTSSSLLMSLTKNF